MVSRRLGRKHLDGPRSPRLARWCKAWFWGTANGISGWGRWTEIVQNGLPLTGEPNDDGLDDGGNTKKQWQRRKTPTKLVFGRALSSFSATGVVDCGRTLSGVVSDNVGTKWWGESGGIVLLNYSGDTFGYFPASTRLFDGGSRLGFVECCERNVVGSAVRPDMVSASWTKVWKSVARRALQLRQETFQGLSGDGTRPGGVGGISTSTLMVFRPPEGSLWRGAPPPSCQIVAPTSPPSSFVMESIQRTPKPQLLAFCLAKHHYLLNIILLSSYPP